MEMFQKVAEFCNSSHPFLEFVRGFGKKLSAKDENFNCFYRQSIGFSGDENCQKKYEFSYNIRYAAKNGRNTGGDKWSIRQTAICERYDSTAEQSRWIMIQLPAAFKTQAIAHMNAGTGRPNPLVLHLMLFLSCGRDWREYINDLEEGLGELEEKALFSRVGRVTPGDFDLTFCHVQAIQKLRKKLLKLQAILDSNMDVAEGFMAHYKEIRVHGIHNSHTDDTTSGTVGMYMAQLRSHRRSVSMLLEYSKGISKVLFQILQQRNDDNIAKSNQIMAKATIEISTTNAGIHRNGEAMEQLTKAASIESGILTKLAEESWRDARSVKILTFVAMLYLPASLIATVLSSSELVKTANGKFRLGSQFWLFPLLSVALMAITWLLVLLWELFYGRKDIQCSQISDENV
ncbi:hypothetical protein FN846DRAFT_967298 [Sphaerosporella brunnea]|uniref:CorA-like transporter domain-containing protein n=1 Tax=Sphaerosporella brunnea TaxID=1250544 RepID=A0A5J5EMJ1_9PEZI|nr:hypothetical protein FN846DRAFT_967298 [Sphaerosporella brunnea]